MLNVLADKYIYKLEQYLPSSGVALSLFDPQKPLDIPDGTDALFIRTTVKITPEVISTFSSSLKFVATASAGTDHVDVKALQKNNIAFTSAAGCNARSVAEYVATVLLIWADEKNILHQDLKIGIVGVGNTGDETERLLRSLGFRTVAYDPPREKKEEPFKSASLNEILNCDILTFHTPLTFHGKYSTFHWLNKEKLNGRHFSLIINASRGGVIDEKELLKTYKNNQIDDYILDVWENEPVFNNEIAKNAFIHTPHIAGYSVQAKLNASSLVTESLCEFFNLEMPKSPEFNTKKIMVRPKAATLAGVLKQLHPIDEYHQKFSNIIGTLDNIKAKGFSQIRTHHPLRNEYKFLTIPYQARKKFDILNRLSS